MEVPFLDLKRQYEKIRHEVRASIDQVLESQVFVLGKEVEKLEEEISRYTGSLHAVGVASGSDAILLSLMALGMGPGEGVITTPFTFFATAGSISHLGCVALFVDIDPDTYNMSPESLELFLKTQCTTDEKGQRRHRDTGVPVRCVIPVHLFGQCADMDPILDLCRSHNLTVIEDAAQAIGSLYQPDTDHGPRSAGTMGASGCFSFYPSKNLGAFGDGGMVVCQDDEIADRIRMLRVHGSRPKYYHKLIGVNSRLDALQAAVLRVKLKYLDQWTEARRQNAQHYNELFANINHQKIGISLPQRQNHNRHIFNQYVIRAPKRDELRNFLSDHDIGTDIYYPRPLHLQACYAHLGHKEGDFPVSEKASQTVLALPIFPEVTSEEQAYVVDTIETFYRSTG
jgi:dTDP-4-amino-4,6-dideoxygalactose transaminase